MSGDERKGETEWPLDPKDYTLEACVGLGAFAKVYKATCSNGQVCAVKVLELEKLNTSIDEVRAEVATMKMCRHENVLPCHCCFASGSNLWVVMPFMDMGSCFHFMSQLKSHTGNKGIVEKFIAIILREALKGLQYLHENGHIHRDIKAGNILLDSRGGVKIADFGVAGWLMEEGERTAERHTFVGTPCWMAPEVMEQLGGYDTKADIWSFGITALELAKGEAPYARFQPIKVMLMTLQDDPPSLKTYPAPKDGSSAPKFSRAFKEIITFCLQRDPKRRPKCETLLRKKFFTSAGSLADLAGYLAAVPPLEKTVSEEDTRLAGMAGVDIVELRAKGTTWDFGSSLAGPSDGEATVTLDRMAKELNLGEYGEGAAPAPAPAAAPAPAPAAATATAAAPAAATPTAAPAAPAAAAPTAAAPAAPASTAAPAASAASAAPAADASAPAAPAAPATAEGTA